MTKHYISFNCGGRILYLGHPLPGGREELAGLVDIDKARPFDTKEEARAMAAKRAAAYAEHGKPIQDMYLHCR